MSRAAEAEAKEWKDLRVTDEVAVFGKISSRISEEGEPPAFKNTGLLCGRITHEFVWMNYTILEKNDWANLKTRWDRVAAEKKQTNEEKGGSRTAFDTKVMFDWVDVLLKQLHVVFAKARLKDATHFTLVFHRVCDDTGCPAEKAAALYYLQHTYLHIHSHYVMCSAKMLMVTFQV